jgi:hypothetical protein
MSRNARIVRPDPREGNLSPGEPRHSLEPRPDVHREKVADRGVFATWQPRYAAHGIATFPFEIVGNDKKPATIGYMKTGLRGSSQLALKFVEAVALGCVCGHRNRIVVADLDDTEEKIIGEGERLFGRSPILWRTGGGKFAMPFRYNGEARLIHMPVKSD